MNTTLVFALLVGVSGSDKKFIDDATQAGMAEVRASQLALKNSQNEEVKRLAQMMIDDHQKAGEELKTIATTKSTDTPADITADQKKNEDKLTKLIGDKFDTEYLKTMVGDHKKAVSLFEKGAKKNDDADLKSFAGKTLPTLKHHLDMAEQTAKSVKKGS